MLSGRLSDAPIQIYRHTSSTNVLNSSMSSKLRDKLMCMSHFDALMLKFRHAYHPGS